MDKHSINQLKKEEKAARKKGNDVLCAETVIKIIDVYSDMISRTKTTMDEEEIIKELHSVIKMLCDKKNQTIYVLIKMYQRLIEKLFYKLSDSDLFKFYTLLHSILKSNSTVHKDFDKISKIIEENDYIKVNEALINLKDNSNFQGLIILRKLPKKLSLGSVAELKPFDTVHTIQSETNNQLTPKLSSISLKSTISSNDPIDDIIHKEAVSNQKKYIPNKDLPYITINISALLSFTQIVTLITNAFQSQHYVSIFSSNNNDFIIFQYEPKTNCLKKAFDCILNKCGMTTPSILQQIRLRLADNKSTNITQYEHFIELTSISGTKKNLEKCFLKVIKSIGLHIISLSICKKSREWGYDLDKDIASFLEAKSSICKYNSDYNQLIEDEGTIVEATNTEASGYYEIYRILSQENYEVGKNISQFIYQFKEDNKDIEAASFNLPRQMKDIVFIIEDCICSFHSYFNYAREKKMLYVHQAVNKFIFNKLYFILYNIYCEKYQKENLIFIQSKKKLNESKSIDEIMSYLEIKEAYRCREEKEYTNQVPYKPSIDSINKIEYEQSPIEKLETLMKGSLELRNTILSVTKGKDELESMDDEIPLFIYMTTQVSLSNLPAELHMIEDYISYSKEIINKENKVLTNLLSAIFYICKNNWDEQQIIIK